MAPAPPNTRECLLVLALLLAILYYTNNRVQDYLIVSPVSPLQHTTSHVNTLQEESPLLHNTRLTWGSNRVPQTTVLANVPGAFGITYGILNLPCLQVGR